MTESEKELDIELSRLKEKIPKNETDLLHKGVWFKSTITGCMHKSHSEAGIIDCVMIDGVWFDRAEK